MDIVKENQKRHDLIELFLREAVERIGEALINIQLFREGQTHSIDSEGEKVSHAGTVRVEVEQASMYLARAVSVLSA